MIYFLIASSVIVFIVLFVVLINIAIKSHASKLGQTKEQYLKDLHMPIQDRRGKQGELLVNIALREVVWENDYLLHTLLVPYNQNGDTTEIDFVIVSTKGIFCIEVKYLVGTIIGDEYSNSWEQIYDDEYRPNKFIRNGFKQNEQHVSLLEKKLGHHYDVNNVVIIANDNNDLSRLNGSHLFTIDSFVHFFHELPDKLNVNAVEEINKKLQKYIATPEQLLEHKRRMQQKYHNN